MTVSIMLTRSIMILLVFAIVPMSYAQDNSENNQISKSNQELNTVTIQSCNCVAFRLDDIQGYWLNNAQIAVMDEFQSRNILLTIGIVGGEKFQFGSDPEITEYVWKMLHAEKPTIKIANHGWIHENFTRYDQKTQSDLRKKSNE